MAEKPVSMIIQAVNNEIIDTLQKHKLHPSVAKLIVKDIYMQICAAADAQMTAERKEYEKAMLEEKREEVKDE